MIGQLRRRSGGAHGGSPTPSTPYVTDGLVFWLDGIEKGSDSTAWTEIITGGKFPYIERTSVDENSVIFADGSNTRMVSQQNEFTPVDYTGTIEFCAEVTNTGERICFAQGGANKLLFAVQKGTYLAYHNTNNGNNRYNLNMPSLFTASANSNICVVNGLEYTTKAGVTWGTGSVNITCIGNRNNGNLNYYMAGRIYSIRMYNRLLTKDEMKANQQVDNQRFNLGLTI